MKTLLSFTLTLLISLLTHATTWQVGPSHTYTKPSQVSTLVQNGDTVLIDAGVYISDVAHWTANNLLLKGISGMAHLKANGSNFGGKAIWVIGGSNTTVENIEFSLCTVVNQNGAGIRQEGINLTVRHCYFHDNDEGILAGDNATSDILIEYTEFQHNGYGDGYSHNLYINHVHSLTFQYNYSHTAKIGHELKSRAYNNYILYNRIADEDTGTASRSIDLPNGGLAIIMGNEIQKGPQAQNNNFIGYGLEGLTNPGPQQLYLINNTMVNNRSTSIFISVQSATGLCKAWNNIAAGTGTFITGAATAFDTAHNLITTIANAGLVNAAGYDYHLLSTSPAINGAADADSAGSFPLFPIQEYLHPTQTTQRTPTGNLDIGAHEYTTATEVTGIATGEDILIYPNPARDILLIRLPGNNSTTQLQLFDINGKKIVNEKFTSEEKELSVVNLTAGIYLLRMERPAGTTVKKIQVY